MTKLRSVVFVIGMTAVLGCGDDGGGSTAGSGGMLAAGFGGTPGIGGTGGMAGGASGTSGVAGMVAGGGGMGGSGGTVAGGGGMGGAGGMGENCVASPNGPPQPTFTWIFDNVLPTCAGPLCHSSAAGGNLMFDTKDGAYAQLMMAGMGMNAGAAASMTHCKDTGLVRVVPNNPDMSLLYAKLRTDMAPPCGNSMPPGGGLCANTIEAVRMWIASGAPNN